MDEEQIVAKCIGVVSVEPAFVKNELPAVVLCIDDGSDRFHEYFIDNLQEVRSLIALLLQALAYHGDLWAQEIYDTHIHPEKPPPSP